MRIVISILLLIMVYACGHTKDIKLKKMKQLSKNSPARNRLITISSGRIGCPLERIDIFDYYELDSFNEAWRAECGQAIFYCSFNHVSAQCTRSILMLRSKITPVKTPR